MFGCLVRNVSTFRFTMNWRYVVYANFSLLLLPSLSSIVVVFYILYELYAHIFIKINLFNKCQICSGMHLLSLTNSKESWSLNEWLWPLSNRIRHIHTSGQSEVSFFSTVSSTLSCFEWDQQINIQNKQSISEKIEYFCFTINKYNFIISENSSSRVKALGCISLSFFFVSRIVHNNDTFMDCSILLIYSW